MKFNLAQLEFALFHFCRRLLVVDNPVIVSVPDKWPKGMVRFHKHDPVDEMSLKARAGKDRIDKDIVTGGNQDRLVAILASDSDSQ